MPSASSFPFPSALFHLDFDKARARLERHVADMAREKGLAVTLNVEPDESPVDGDPRGHRINLRRDDNETFVCLLHDAFAGNDGFFYSLVLPRLNAALDELAAR